MKVYYNGYNLHRQFPTDRNIVEAFIDHDFQHVENIEVSYHFVVLLVADVVVLQGAKTKTVQLDQKIAQICCDDDKVLVLLENGDLLKITDTVINVPKLMDLESGDYIKQISTRSKMTVALTKFGILYNIPNRLNFKNTNLVDVKTGREHCLLLDKSGNIFSFGRGSRGQLGHGSLDDEPEPKLVEALAGIKIRSIETGGWHSCAVSQEGDLYVWGWNGNGQLGLSDREDSGEDVVAVMATPHVLNLDFNIRIVGCGNKHTVILSEDSRLYGCGWNKYKQLKDDCGENFYKVVYLGDFSKEAVRGIRCGPWNTLVLCD